MLRYAITNGHSTRGDLSADAARWAAEGIDWVLLRERSLSADELLSSARAMLRELAGSSTRLLVHSRLDVALAAGADGVHLTARAGELRPSQCRQLWERSRQLWETSRQLGDSRARGTGLGDTSLGDTSRRDTSRRELEPSFSLSVSCHSIEEVVLAATGGADLILFGPVFEKRIEEERTDESRRDQVRVEASPQPARGSKGFRTLPGCGLQALAAACDAAATTPVLALGGIERNHAAACLQAGAAGVAGIRLFQRPAGPARLTPQAARS